MANAAHLLREYGLRVTPQRLLLIEIISSMEDHFTAEDVYKRVVRTYPTVSLVSVYRGLETFRKLGLVTRTEVGGISAAYEWALGDRHHHLICTHCGMVEQLQDSELQVLRDTLRQNHGFQATIDHYAIFGLCRFCAAPAASTGSHT